MPVSLCGPERLRTSVGSTEGSASLLARFGFGGPTRAKFGLWAQTGSTSGAVDRTAYAMRVLHLNGPFGGPGDGPFGWRPGPVKAGQRENGSAGKWAIAADF